MNWSRCSNVSSSKARMLLEAMSWEFSETSTIPTGSSGSEVSRTCGAGEGARGFLYEARLEGAQPRSKRNDAQLFERAAGASIAPARRLRAFAGRDRRANS